MAARKDANELSVVLVTDCGSTTTKAVLFERLADGWHQTHRGEAPTTVEKPVADVTIGARNAFREVEELSGRHILSTSSSPGESPFHFRKSADPGNGIDLYLSTSSAGGGLQMIVAGVVAEMTTESAERAALGAGAIVMEAISIDDGREPHERVQRIRHLRPDIVLIAGGTDGGTVDHPLELAEVVLQANPRPRFGDTLRLPVIYAANNAATAQARELLERYYEFVAVPNLRPKLEVEQLGPAREAIHELFLHHVMSHAPGYRTLLSWTPEPILPTPAAVGNMVQTAAERQGTQILAVDIGGATTDVFSVVRPAGQSTPVFNRTVSANLGMSYSVANVLHECGIDNIRRWLPFGLDDEEIEDRLRNKMIRPTSIPHTLEDLILEQAVCREALRLALEHHRRLAVGLKGTKQQRSIGDIFKAAAPDSLIDLWTLDLIIGSGGVLSHAPDRRSAALMMLDAYQPLGITHLAVDSIFMMPHLGVFATVNPEAAIEIFFRDCLIPLGTVIAPVSRPKAPRVLCTVRWEGGQAVIEYGELALLPLPSGTKVNATLEPASGVDVGAGPGATREAVLTGGQVGLILDGRGRPLPFGKGVSSLDANKRWYSAMGLPLP